MIPTALPSISRSMGGRFNNFDNHSSDFHRVAPAQQQHV